MSRVFVSGVRGVLTQQNIRLDERIGNKSATEYTTDLCKRCIRDFYTVDTIWEEDDAATKQRRNIVIEELIIGDHHLLPRWNKDSESWRPLLKANIVTNIWRNLKYSFRYKPSWRLTLRDGALYSSPEAPGLPQGPACVRDSAEIRLASPGVASDPPRQIDDAFQTDDEQAPDRPLATVSTNTHGEYAKCQDVDAVQLADEQTISMPLAPATPDMTGDEQDRGAWDGGNCDPASPPSSPDTALPPPYPDSGSPSPSVVVTGAHFVGEDPLAAQSSRKQSATSLIRRRGIVKRSVLQKSIPEHRVSEYRFGLRRNRRVMMPGGTFPCFWRPAREDLLIMLDDSSGKRFLTHVLGLDRWVAASREEMHPLDKYYPELELDLSAFVKRLLNRPQLAPYLRDGAYYVLVHTGIPDLEPARVISSSYDLYLAMKSQLHHYDSEYGAPFTFILCPRAVSSDIVARINGEEEEYRSYTSTLFAPDRICVSSLSDQE